MAMQDRQVPALSVFYSNGENRVHTRNIKYQTALCNYAMQFSVLSLLFKYEENRDSVRGRTWGWQVVELSGLFLYLLCCLVVVWPCADRSLVFSGTGAHSWVFWGLTNLKTSSYLFQAPSLSLECCSLSNNWWRACFNLNSSPQNKDAVTHQKWELGEDSRDLVCWHGRDGGKRGL